MPDHPARLDGPADLFHQAPCLMALYQADHAPVLVTGQLEGLFPESARSLDALMSACRLERPWQEIRKNLLGGEKIQEVAKTSSGRRWILRLFHEPESGLTALFMEEITESFHEHMRRRILLELMDQTPDGIGIARPDLKPLWQNPSLVRMHGANNAGELLDRTVEQLQPGGIGPYSVQEALDIARREGFLVTESEVAGPESTRRYSQVVTAHRDPFDQEWYYSAVFRDITELKSVERELQAATNKLEFLLDEQRSQLERQTEQVRYGREVWRSLVEYNQDLVLFTAEDGEILFSNRAFLGQSGFHLVGESVFDLIDTDHRERVQEQFSKLIRGGTDHVSTEAEIQAPTGGHYYCLVLVNRVKRRGGSHAATWIFSDATDARDTREQLLANEKMAATGRMAARIAHEINNPLAAIKGSLGLLRMDTREHGLSSEYIDVMDRELERVSNIIRQMYGLYRPEQDQVGELPLAQLVNDCCLLLRSTAAARDIELEQRVGAGIRVLGTEGGLRQVLFNVLNNAIDLSPDSARIRIEARENGDLTELRVIDRGPGIPAELEGRIFEPFFTTKDSYGGRGLGLGLSVSASLMHGMGGDLRLENHDGGGACAVISLRRPGESGRTDIPIPS